MNEILALLNKELSDGLSEKEKTEMRRLVQEQYELRDVMKEPCPHCGKASLSYTWGRGVACLWINGGEKDCGYRSDAIKGNPGYEIPEVVADADQMQQEETLTVDKR